MCKQCFPACPHCSSAAIRAQARDATVALTSQLPTGKHRQWPHAKPSAKPSEVSKETMNSHREISSRSDTSRQKEGTFETANSIILMIHISESNVLTLTQKKKAPGYIHIYPQVCNQKAILRFAHSYAYHHNQNVER